MIENWKKFEADAFSYLTEKYSDSNTKFTLIGGSDSNKGDIFVENSNKDNFFIEIKSPNSQAGQFALNQTSKSTWEFSDLNRTSSTDNSNIIIDDLNNGSDIKISTAQTVLNTKKEIKLEWIKDFYKERNVKFIVSKYNNEYIIIPIDNINNYFNIEGSVRKKGSGSSDVTGPFWEKIKHLPIFENLESVDHIEKKRILTFTKIPREFTSKKNVIEDIVDGEIVRLQFEVLENNTVYIRKLSTTSNPTIIFTLNTKQSQLKSDLQEFINVIY